MIQNSRLKLLHYHYHLSSSQLEKHILDNWARDNEIPKIYKADTSSDYEIHDLSFQEHFEFLYDLYAYVHDNYYIEPNLYSVLKKFCIRSGFFNSNLKSLHTLLLENVKQGNTANQVMSLIKL